MSDHDTFASRVVDQRGPMHEEKSHISRERFRRRYREKIKEALASPSGSGPSDITGDGNLVVEVDPWDIPTIEHDLTSTSRELVIPGNNHFSKGDRIPKPPKSQNGQSGAGMGGSEGKVRLPLTEDQWADAVFGDLELPNMDLKKAILSSEKLHLEQHGFSSVGPAHLLDLKRTLLRSDGRLQVIEQQIEDDIDEEKRKMRVEEEIVAREEASGNEHSHEWVRAKEAILKHRERIAELEKELGVVPEFEKVDLRYRYHEQLPTPIAQAVVFFHLDVSGSMSDKEKRLALLLFRLQYRFIAKMYQRTHVVLIHYHGDAYECSSVEEFFEQAGTGGTEYSSCLKLHRHIQEERYPADRYNIYITHASDGDNHTNDRDVTVGLLNEAVLPRTQYYVYAQMGIANESKEDTESWRIFRAANKVHKNVALVRLNKPEDILPAFRRLFRKKGVKQR